MSNRFHSCYPLIDNGGICVYCGVRADTLDHFVPTSITKALMSCTSIVPMGGMVKVPACRECNSIAGAILFKTIAAKRRHIQEHLRCKYSSYLETPDWSEEELDDLGRSLRERVEAGLKVRRWVTERLAWRNTSNAAHANLKIVKFASSKADGGVEIRLKRDRCETCDSEFFKGHSQQKYCSRACNEKARRQRAKEELAELRRLAEQVAN